MTSADASVASGVSGLRVEAPTRALHALAWAWWALAAAATVQLAPSPVYVVLVVAIAALVVESHAPTGPLARAFPLLVTFAVAFVGLRVVLTALTTHGGPDVLVRLPALSLPAVLGGFTVGGPVQTSVILRSVAEGVVLVGVVAAFGAFNAVVSHHELVRIAPRAFHELGLILTVALAFVPSTVAAVTAAREADRARTGGRARRRGRPWRLAVPVLESGMERALHLAESMDSRGFGHRSPGRTERAAGWLALGSLLALGGAFAALVGRARPVAVGMGLAGTLALVAAVVVASRASRRPRYRPTRPGRRDLVIMACVAIAPVGVVLLTLADEPSLVWLPSESPVPGFHPLVGLAVAALAVPALRPRHRSAPPSGREPLGT